MYIIHHIGLRHGKNIYFSQPYSLHSVLLPAGASEFALGTFWCLSFIARILRPLFLSCLSEPPRDCDHLSRKCSKEEKLLGYTASQRQRVKALDTLGLSERDFEKCRAVLLSSLGPSALGSGSAGVARPSIGSEDEEQCQALQEKAHRKTEALHHVFMSMTPCAHHA